MGTTGLSITLANSIIGVGILAMPFCFQQCGVLLATLILLLMGLVSRLCCYFLLKSALLARRRNFEFLAFHVFGSAGKFGVEVGIIGFLMGTCIAYFVVVGDLGPQIISKMFNINQSDMLRTSIMVIVSLVCVLPLGLLRNVDSLSNVSAATIGFYFCLVMKVIAEAASVLLAGDWQSRVEMWRPAGVLQCVPIFSMALFCQTQLFEIFESLPSLSLEKMNLVTKNAINICTGVYFTLGLFGYIAFNTQEISGNILMSLSPTMLSDVIKLGFVMSLAFSFPLIIFPCRASLYSLLYKKVHSSHHDHIINHSIPEGSFRRITVGIVACTLGASLVLPNIELVLGLVGSTIGVLVCLVFPAACFLHLTFKNTNERILAKGVLILGLVIMVLGTYANLQAAENQVDKYDEKYITKERIDKIVEDFFQKMEKTNGVNHKPPDNAINKDIKKLNGETIKESVVLPPNPVPPESQSNEKNENKNIKETKIAPRIKDVMPNPIKDTVDKVSETHPKNLNKQNDVKAVNGVGDSKVKEKKERQNDEKILKQDIKPQSNDEKNNMIKQQQLIETIKQHGEEQKELIKEQKEILDEIYKTKQELQKNKDEEAHAEAKKIAVESIKKIANIALQSLGGASEKPGQVGENKISDNFEKLANEAVQEIAQKAVESIVAIKETQEKPEQPLKQPNLPALSNIQSVNNENSAINNNNINQKTQENIGNPPPSVPIQNNIPSNIRNGNNANVGNSEVVQKYNKNIANQQAYVQPNVLQTIQSVNEPNIKQVPLNVNEVVPNDGTAAISNNQLIPNNPQASANIGQPAPKSDQVASNMPAALPPSNIKEPSNIVKNVAPVINPVPPQANINLANIETRNAQNNIQSNQQVQNEANHNKQPVEIPIPQEKIVKAHSHSPDEPQSYKLGEDTEKNNNVPANNAVVQNVPLALALNGNSQTNNNQPNIPNDSVVKNNAENNIQVGDQKLNPAVRRKREVVDCTEKSTLKPEDKEICKALIDTPSIQIVNNNYKEILSSKVDLIDTGLPKNLPLQSNMLLSHHLIRSLKSIENSKNR
ncbi:unnamed protein product [Chilo suppressalis]|uniref:Amino acid transporter transmembrane domain-containing protein n=1 Tax=Chilo suppressalis TaxID=168631 RepID=A0ABN8AS86_CHISP|nr:unnamed protein product [Chilo suppressalis]